MNIFISTWVLLVAGLVFAFPMIYIRVKDTTDINDETLYESSTIYKNSIWFTNGALLGYAWMILERSTLPRK
jgi:hypothetical protein